MDFGRYSIRAIPAALLLHPMQLAQYLPITFLFYVLMLAENLIETLSHYSLFIKLSPYLFQ